MTDNVTTDQAGQSTHTDQSSQADSTAWEQLHAAIAAYHGDAAALLADVANELLTTVAYLNRHLVEEDLGQPLPDHRWHAIAAALRPTTLQHWLRSTGALATFIDHLLDNPHHEAHSLPALP